MQAQRYSRNHVLTASFVGVLLLCFAFVVPGLAQRKPKNAKPVSEKQKFAEAAANRVLTRFYETLDFGVIYREMYGSDQLKQREVQVSIGNLLLQGKDVLRVPPLIDFAAMERAYIAKRNYDFLVSAENFTDDGDREIFYKELKLNIEQYYMPIISPANRPILTSAQLDSLFTANLNQMSVFLRKHVVSNNFRTDLYRRRIASFEESWPAQQDLRRRLGLKQQIYVVQRERLHLYFVEQNGQFRMLSMTPRVQD